MPSQTEPPESDSGSTTLPEYGDSIDPATFEQILEMDDDESDREFSNGIVFGFFDQAEATFKKMDTALEAKDLPELSALGHFLKGSSATLGLTKVKDSCEKIQHYGLKKDEHGEPSSLDEKACLAKIKETLEDVRTEYSEAERILKKFYNDSGAGE